MIEQLHYTWSVLGLQGRGRFQVTGASPGLRDLSSVGSRLALRLCRWVAGGDRTAKSYGWIDARGQRLVFLRSPAGLTPDGRPGNFTAHVLMAPTGSLRVQDLLTPATVDPWWKGQPTEATELPTLEPQTMCPPYPRPNLSETQDALAQMLSGGLSGRVTGGWSAVLDATVHLALRLPGSLDDLASFSTHEAGDSLGWFKLVGSQGEAGRAQVVPLAAVTSAAMFTSTSRDDHRSLVAAARAVAAGERSGWADFTVLAAALHGAHATTQVDLTAVTTALQRPSTAADLLEDAAVRRAVAAAIRNGEPAVLTALEASASAVPVELLEVLGADVAQACADDAADASNGAAALRAIVAHVSALPHAVLRGLVGLAVRSATATAITEWSLQLITEALCLPDLAPSVEVELIRSAVASKSIRTVLGQGRIPVHRRVRIAVDGRHRLPPEIFARLIQEDIGASRPIVPALAADGQLASVLDALPPEEAADALRRACGVLPYREYVDALSTVLGRMSPTSAGRVLREARRGVYAPELEALHDVIIRRLVREQTDQTAGPLDIGGLRAECSSTAEGVAWRWYLEALTLLTMRMDEPARTDVDGAIRRLPEPARSAAGTLTIQAAAAALDPQADTVVIARYLRWIVGCFQGYAPAPFSAVIVAALRQRLVHRQPSLAVACIVLLATEPPLGAGAGESLEMLLPHMREQEWAKVEELLRQYSPKAVKRARAMRDGRMKAR